MIFTRGRDEHCQLAGVVSGDAEALRDRVIRSVIDLELPAEVQQLVLKTIKNA